MSKSRKEIISEILSLNRGEELKEDINNVIGLCEKYDYKGEEVTNILENVRNLCFD